MRKKRKSRSAPGTRRREPRRGNETTRTKRARAVRLADSSRTFCLLVHVDVRGAIRGASHGTERQRTGEGKLPGGGGWEHGGVSETRGGTTRGRHDDATRFAGGRRRDSRAGSSRRTFRLWLPKVDCTAASDSRRYMHVFLCTRRRTCVALRRRWRPRPHCSVPASGDEDAVREGASADEADGIAGEESEAASVLESPLPISMSAGGGGAGARGVSRRTETNARGEARDSRRTAVGVGGGGVVLEAGDGLQHILQGQVLDGHVDRLEPRVAPARAPRLCQRSGRAFGANERHARDDELARLARRSFWSTRPAGVGSRRPSSSSYPHSSSRVDSRPAPPSDMSAVVRGAFTARASARASATAIRASARAATSPSLALRAPRGYATLGASAPARARSSSAHPKPRTPPSPPPPRPCPSPPRPRPSSPPRTPTRTGRRRWLPRSSSTSSACT